MSDRIENSPPNLRPAARFGTGVGASKLPGTSLKGFQPVGMAAFLWILWIMAGSAAMADGVIYGLKFDAAALERRAMAWLEHAAVHHVQKLPLTSVYFLVST